MNGPRGIYLLLWKNVKLKLRHPLILLMELAIPCIFTVLLALVRMKIDFDTFPNVTTYSPMPVETWHSLDSREMLYAPSNNLTDAVMTIFANTSRATPKVIPFKDEESMVSYYVKENANIISCGLVFQGFPSAGEDVNLGHLSVKLRFPYVPKQIAGFQFAKIDQFTWQTARLFPMFQPPGPRAFRHPEGGPPNYLDEGFLYVHHQLVKSLILHRNASLAESLERVRLNIQRFPYPPYIADKFLFALQFFYPLVLMLSFIYPSVNLTKSIVLEKELRLKEIMKMMGLQEWLHWSSWFLNSFFWSLPSLLLITILMCTPLKDTLCILTYSNPIIIFLFFTFYTVNSISFSFLVSTGFSRANVAGVMSGALYFVTFLPYFQVNIAYNDLSFIQKILLCSIFNTNMGIGCMLLSSWESQHVGLQWWNLLETASPDDNLTFFHILLMFSLNSIVYFLLALYIQTVSPGEFGLPQKWYFFAQASYWKTVFGLDSVSEGASFKVNEEETSSNEALSENSYPLKSGVSISNLSKSYDKGKSFSLKSFTMNMEANEITVLLGHNGAGKTTLMSILCGLIPPTSGTACIGERDLLREMEHIRKDLGICPQFDVLFDHLTVEEHLWFYSQLKQIEPSKIQEEMDSMLSQLDLEFKRHSQAYTLSGGQKRRLSVGIALIGGSKFILLDECTSGMDVSARRFIWDLLIKEKRNRTILLSTHFMEEADVLADKIAILDAGALKCFGTPMELKRAYGLGYLLTFATQNESINIRPLNELICAHVPASKLLSSVGTEVSFSLPDSETSHFEGLFQTIEGNLEGLGVVSYAISVTTIEEVFLRVGDFAAEATQQFNTFGRVSENGGENDDSLLRQIRPNSLKTNSGLVRTLQVYRALLTKKLLFFLRNPFLIYAQGPMPSLLLIMAIVIRRQQLEKVAYTPALPLSLAPYKTLYMSAFHDGSEEAKHLSTLYLDSILSTGHDVQLSVHEFPNDTKEQTDTYLANYGRHHEAEYNLYYMMAASFTQTPDNGLILSALFNNQAYHASATSLALLENLLLRYLLPEESPPIQLDIWNEPMPRKARDALLAREFDNTLQVQLTNSILFSTCSLLASFIILLVKEKASFFKHIQQISGLHLAAYWSANFLLDYALFLGSTFAMSLTIYLLNVDAFHAFPQIAYLWLIFAFTGLSALPFIYLCSLIFTDPATAYVRVSLYMLIAGQITFLMVLILKIPDFDMLEQSRTMDSLFSYLLPVYTLSISVFSLYQNIKSQEFCLGDITWREVTYHVQDFCKPQYTALLGEFGTACCPEKCGKICLHFSENYLSWEKPGLGQYLFAFLCQALLFWSLVAILEIDKIHLPSRHPSHLTASVEDGNAQGDDDVQREEERIQKTQQTISLPKTDSLVVQNVSKRYGNGFTAVRNLTFGVKRAECFGLLGTNGAGKSTLFKMITGAEKITSGDIFVSGSKGAPLSVKTDLSRVFKDIGYCPQFDGLLEQLTGRETLRIVARIRGLDELAIETQIDHLARMLFFGKHINNPVSSYSGGTKRKLSFATAIVGNPLIVFLDEVSTGVDPVSRRCLWNAVQLVRAAGSSILLTSHSMDECEALCGRLCVMVNSRISCIGSPLHLKLKYGTGYLVQMKLASKEGTGKEATEGSLTDVEAYLTSRWPACRLESAYNNLLTFRIDTANVKLSTLFGDIERLKDSLAMQEYAICQTSLEQIFLAFARKQRPSP